MTERGTFLDGGERTAKRGSDEWLRVPGDKSTNLTSEREKFLHHLNFVRVSGINTDFILVEVICNERNGTRNEIYFFSQ